jgi:hypothetical protein
VLRRADGVVFVADSQVNRLEDNRTAWRDAARYLGQMGHDFSTFPLVVQFNKRDLPHIVPTEQLRKLFRTEKSPSYEAIAIKGVGVRETLQAAMRLVLADVQRKLSAQVKT